MTVQLDLPDPTWVGTTAIAKVTFRTPGSSRPVDPTTTSFVIQEGDGTIVTWEFGGSGSIVRSKQGLYTAAIPLTVAGNWRIKAVGTGACDVVEVSAPFPVTAAPY